MKSAELTCTAAHWVDKRKGTSTYYDEPEFRICWKQMGMIAEGLRLEAGLKKKVDSSLKGRKIVFELS